jgi:hypothetical protein
VTPTALRDAATPEPTRAVAARRAAANAAANSGRWLGVVRIVVDSAPATVGCAGRLPALTARSLFSLHDAGEVVSAG